MTPLQKRIVRQLLALSYEHGFSLFRLYDVMDRINIHDRLPDGTGVTYDQLRAALMEFADTFENRSQLRGFLELHPQDAPTSVGIPVDFKDLLENWSHPATERAPRSEPKEKLVVTEADMAERYARFREAVRKLHQWLEEPEPGCHMWHVAVRDLTRDVRETASLYGVA